MTVAKDASKILASYRKESEDRLEERKKRIEKELPEYMDLERRLKEKGVAFLRLNLETKDSQALEEASKELDQIQEEMKDLLEKEGYGKDFLEKEYHCEVCQDEGVVEGDLCDCKKRLMVQLSYKNSEIEEKLYNENFENFDLNLFRQEQKPGEALSPRDMMESVVQFSKGYVDTFPNGESLLFSGSVGVGKTFLCSCIAKEVIEKGYSVIYQSSPQLMKFLWDYYYSSFHEREDMRRKYDILRTSDLLVIDDLGTENLSDSSLSHFFDLLNNRLQNHRSMIISTNLELEHIRSHYDERISSRILGEFNVITLYGDDLRMKKLGF